MTNIEICEMLLNKTDFSEDNCRDLSGVIAAASDGKVRYCNSYTDREYTIQWSWNGINKSVEIKEESYGG